jgi:tripartite-type tricarboxylate transporter receptor subunit TctC
MTTAQRSALVPDVPTLAEAGVPGIDVTSWYGMLAPHGTPIDIRDAIFAVTRDVLSTPAMQEKLSSQALSVTIETPDQLAARIRRETALWADVIQKEHITIQ